MSKVRETHAYSSEYLVKGFFIIPYNMVHIIARYKKSKKDPIPIHKISYIIHHDALLKLRFPLI